jgi:hypothetical protein
MANNKLPTRAREPAVSEKDPEFMFKVGFLDDVYNEVKTKPIITRFPPEPNGFLQLGMLKQLRLTLASLAITEGSATYGSMTPTLRLKKRSSSTPLWMQ